MNTGCDRVPNIKALDLKRRGFIYQGSTSLFANCTPKVPSLLKLTAQGEKGFGFRVQGLGLML